MIFRKVPKMDEGKVSWRRQKAWEEELEDIALRLENPDLDPETKEQLERREAALKAKFDKIRAHESYDEDGKHETCENCGTMLNDMGTCPKCDEGEEDYGDNEVEEEEEELLTEGTGADVNNSLKNLLNSVSEENKQNWQRTLEKVLDAIPDSLADELMNKTIDTLSNVTLSSSDKDKIVDKSEGLVDDEAVKNVRTVGDFFKLFDPEELARTNPGLVKAIVTTILYIVAVIEPTPVVDIIAIVVTAMPESAVANIVATVAKMNPAVKIVSSLLKTEEMEVEEGLLGTAVKVASNLVGNLFEENKPLREAKRTACLSEEMSAEEKLIKAFPDVDWNFNNTDNNLEEDMSLEDKFIKAFPDVDWSFKESFDEYDDDYAFDDVEEDRIHSSLYGGDRAYCRCGSKLVRTEWGSYCPDCDPETAVEETVHVSNDIDDEF